MTAHIDREILEVEQRIARRRMAVELTARAAWRRTVNRVISPAGLLSAAALGFVTVVGVFRRQPRAAPAAAKAGRWAGVLGLAASGALTLLRAQYGSPLNAANAALDYARRFKERKSSFGRRSAVAH
jgi:hypothetical protein